MFISFLLSPFYKFSIYLFHLSAFSSFSIAIDHITRNGFDQNINADFSGSKRMYNDCMRYFTASFFYRTLLNGEKTLRPWLAYSVSKGRVYCVPCLLFGEKSSFANDGFNDWKNVGHRITHHENSNAHHDCSIQFKDRAKIQARIDANITLLYEQEISYWRNVLKRVVAVIKSLASRGLPFRGDDEKFGSQHNGNYMMLLELIAQFDRSGYHTLCVINLYYQFLNG